MVGTVFSIQTSIKHKKALSKGELQFLFYVFSFIIYHISIAHLFQEDTFTLKQWTNAIGMLNQLNKPHEAIDLANKILIKYPSSSFLYFQLAKANLLTGNKSVAQTHLNKALNLDPENAEAKDLLETIAK